MTNQSRKTIGELTEAIILAKMLALGYSVSLPFGNNQRYDMILDNGKQLLRAQCKTGRFVNGCVSFATASKNGFTNERKSYHGEVEIFLVHCEHTGHIYQVPVDITTSNEMRLRVEAPKEKSPKTTINWAKDFQVAA